MGGFLSQSRKYGKTSTAKEIVDGHGGMNSLVGKTAIVTGGNSGIGLETCKVLAYAGARVILASRSVEAGTKAISDEIVKSGHGGYVSSSDNIVVKQLDLASFQSIKDFAQDVIASEGEIDFLILNAGIMALPSLTRTSAGFESQVGVNHFGHFYLTSLLLPKITKQDSKCRIVSVSSMAHTMGDVDISDLHFQNGRSYGAWSAYGQSKLCNILFAKELADRYENTNISSFSLHPGVIQTNLIRHSLPEQGCLFYLYKGLVVDKSIPQGASTTVWACLAPELNDCSGAYLDNCAISSPNARGQDSTGALRKQLWEITEKQIEVALAGQ